MNYLVKLISCFIPNIVLFRVLTRVFVNQGGTSLALHILRITHDSDYYCVISVAVICLRALLFECMFFFMFRP